MTSKWNGRSDISRDFDSLRSADKFDPRCFWQPDFTAYMRLRTLKQPYNHLVTDLLVLEPKPTKENP